MKKSKIIGILIGVLCTIFLLIFLYSKFNIYTITLMVDEKSYYEIENLKKGEKATVPKEPTKEGYTFSGWYLNDELFDFNKEITENLVLEAKWELNKYNITIKTGAGEVIDTKVNHGEKIKLLYTPKKSGYTFAGWYVDDEKFDLDTEITHDLILEAKWTKKKTASYVVEYYLMDKEGSYSEEPNEQEKFIGKINSIVSPLPKNIKGYTTPELLSTSVSADGSTVIKYYYSINKYTLTILGDEGVKDITGDGVYFYNDEVEINYTLNEGYAFVDYSEDIQENIFTMPDNDVTITISTISVVNANYKVEHYKMNLDGKYNSLPDETDDLIGVIDTVVTPDVKSYIGFEAPEKAELVVKSDGSAVLKYYYVRNKYILNVEMNNAIKEIKGIGEYYYEQDVDLKVILNSGYTFKKWSNGNRNDSFNYIIPANDTTLKVIYDINKYTIEYELNGGKLEKENRTEYTVETEDFTLNNPSKVGYTFKGWSVNGNSPEKDLIIKKGTIGNLSIEAIFEESTDTLYKVEHYQMNLDGKYDKTPYEVEELKGTTNAVIKPKVKVYEGFKSPKEEEITIKADGSTVLKYYYERNIYTLTIEGDKGIEEVIGSGEYYYEEEVTVSVKLKEGYSFEKWSNGKTEIEYKHKIKSKDEIIKGSTTPITYTIEYELNGGKLEKENRTEYTVETEDFTLNNPSKLGYTFKGWKVNGKESDGKIKQGTIGNLSIEAIFEANTDTLYKVEHYLMDKEGNYSKTPYEVEELKGTTDKVVNPKVKKYENYVSPKEEEITIKADGSTVLKYYYERVKYTLTIEGDKGIEEVIGSGEYYYEEEVTVSVKLKDGYSFKEWVLDNKQYATNESTTIEVKNSLTLKATTTPKLYVVKFVSNGGSVVADSNVYFGSVIEKPNNPIKTGHAFIGWYSDEELTKAFDFNSLMPAKNITLYAKWQANSSTINFNTYGGTEVASIIQYYGTKVEAPTEPTKEGYTFINWYIDSEYSEVYEFTTMPENEITLHAKWQANEYIIIFDANGGKGIMKDQTFIYDISSNLNINEYTNAGYTFLGWSDTADGNVIYENGSLVNNLISSGCKKLYAVWSPITYTIEYELNGGKLEKENRTEYTVETEDFTLNNPSKVGYTFKGWSVNGNSPEKDLIIKKGTIGNLNIEAIFEESTDTLYKVEHYQMNLDGKYDKTPYEVEELKGTTNDVIKPKVKVYEGFKSPKEEEITIKADGSTVLKYYYERNIYTLTIEGDKGIEEVIGSGEYYYEEEVTISVKLKEGYSFEKWSNGKTEIEYKHKIKSKDEIIKGSTTPITYTIEYELNGGKLEKENRTEYTVETEDFTLNNPSKLGYTFKGWKVNGKESDGKIKQGTIGKLSIEAIFEANTDTLYKVEHYLMDKEGNYSKTPYEVEELKGTTDKVVKPKVKKYENYVSPKEEEITIKADGSTVLKYYYERVKYTLTIEGDKGIEEVIGSGEYYYEEEVTVSVKLKDGYSFEKWSNGKTEIEFKYITLKDEIIKGSTTPITYTIEYELNGGKLEKENRTEYTVETEDFTLNNPSKVGYIFVGWKVNGKESDGKIKQGTIGNLSIEAIYNPITYQIVYNGNGHNKGSMTNSTHKYDEVSTLSDIGYSKEYIITYNYNYTNGNIEKSYIETIFTGWSETRDGLVKYSNKEEILNLTTENNKVINLYAHWRNPVISLKTPVRDGYVFVGWSTTSDGKNIIKNSINYVLGYDIELYAVWKLEPIFESLSFDLYKDENAKEKYSINTYSKGDKSFYIKLPNDGYLDINSVKFGLNTPITLNTKAEASSNYIDLIAKSSNKIALTNYTVLVKTIDDGKNWIGASTQKNLIGVKLFLQVLGSQYGGKNIGIAKNFGLTSENVGNEHYISTRTTIGSNTFIFFAKEGTPSVTIIFKNGKNSILTVSVPKGSTVPEIGEYKLSGYNFVNWYSDSEFVDEYDFSKPIYDNVTIYGKYDQGDIDISWYDEDATVYEVCTKKELKGFAALASNGTNFKDKIVKIICDVDLNNEEWTPISTFNGTLDGENHLISNLKITTSTGNVGFFSTLSSSAKIRNIKFNNVEISNLASSNTGTIAGSSSARIDRISVNNVTISGQGMAGGIVGSASSGSVINECSVTNGKISVSSTDVGGIVAISSGNITLTNLYANVTVSSESSAAPDAGGILGNYSSGTNNLIMKNVIFTGKVSADPWMYNSVGAIYGRIGLNKTGSDAFSDDKEGNKINWFYDVSKIGLSGSAYLNRGTGKTTLELQSKATYSGWDTNIWNITDGIYPTLKWMK